jgi:hypothetical protein
MDNLVRAKNGKPFVHFNFVDSAGNVAMPVLDSNVYDAYLEFVSYPDRFRVSTEKPPSDAAHVVLERDKVFYWIPKQYKYDFLRLALITTSRGGQRLDAQDEFYSVILKGIIRVKAPNRFGVIEIIVRIDKRIPNDWGNAKFTIGSSTVSYDIGEYLSEDGPRPFETDLLRVFFDPSVSPEMKTVADLRFPIPAKVFLRHHYPQSPDTHELLDKMRSAYEQPRTNSGQE